jgi:hypothetical protein
VLASVFTLTSPPTTWGNIRDILGRPADNSGGLAAEKFDPFVAVDFAPDLLRSPSNQRVFWGEPCAADDVEVKNRFGVTRLSKIAISATIPKSRRSQSTTLRGVTKYLSIGIA